MKIAITPVTSVIIVLIGSSGNHSLTVLGWELEVLAGRSRGSGAERGASQSFSQEWMCLTHNEALFYERGSSGKQLGENMLEIQVCLSLPFNKSVVFGALKGSR